MPLSNNSFAGEDISGEPKSQLISTRSFSDLPVRIYGTPDKPLFVAADVCRILDLSNPTEALRSLETDEKLTLSNAEGQTGHGGAQFFNCITESGLYTLIFKSRKPEAKEFRRWVTSEVLPSIRHTGKYAIHSDEAPLSIPEPTRQRLVIYFKTLDEIKGRGVGVSIAAQIARDLLLPPVSVESLPAQPTGQTEKGQSDAASREKISPDWSHTPPTDRQTKALARLGLPIPTTKREAWDAIHRARQTQPTEATQHASLPKPRPRFGLAPAIMEAACKRKWQRGFEIMGKIRRRCDISRGSFYSALRALTVRGSLEQRGNFWRLSK